MNTDRIERLLTLIQALQSGRAHTVNELAQLASVSRRTVFRDLELLARTGITYTYDRATRHYSTERATLLPPVHLTHAEALALLMATRLMLSQVVPDQTAAASAALKVESMLPPAIRDHCGPLIEHIVVRKDPASDPTPIANLMSVLQSALVRQTKLAARYDSYYEGRVIETRLHPHRLIYIQRGWYLIAFSELHDATRTFKVERFIQLDPLNEIYEPDPSFNLDDYFGNAWLMVKGDKPYHVKIRFLKNVAGNVDEITWHKTQQTAYEEDGSLIFEADVDGVDEMSWWVLSYGDQAQVLEPPELREILARRAERMYEYYHRRGDWRPEEE